MRDEIKELVDSGLSQEELLEAVYRLGWYQAYE